MPDEKQTDSPDEAPNVHKIITERDGIRLTSRFKVVREGPTPAEGRCGAGRPRSYLAPARAGETGFHSEKKRESPNERERPRAHLFPKTPSQGLLVAPESLQVKSRPLGSCCRIVN